MGTVAFVGLTWPCVCLMLRVWVGCVKLLDGMLCPAMLCLAVPHRPWQPIRQRPRPDDQQLHRGLQPRLMERAWQHHLQGKCVPLRARLVWQLAPRPVPPCLCVACVLHVADVPLIECRCVVGFALQ